MRRALPRLLAAAAATACLLGVCLPLAEAGPIFSRKELIDADKLAPLLERGELALVELDGDRLKQALVLGVVDAPRERVWDALMDVRRFPDFLRTIASTQVMRESKRKDQVEFHWKLAVPLITLDGFRQQRGRRPHLIQARHNKGHFKGSRERWELFPLDGGARTLAVCYRALDVQSGGLVIRTLANLEPTFAAALSLASSYIHLRAIQRRVTGAPPLEPRPKSGPVPPFTPLPRGGLVELDALLELGQLALIESHPDGTLAQVALTTRVQAPTELLVKIAQAPERYPEFIRNFAEMQVGPAPKGAPAGAKSLAWELEIPFDNLEGTSLMTVQEGAVDVVNTGGDIPRGRFRWELRAGPPGFSYPVHYTYSDLRQASMFTRMLLEKQPLFEHGAVIAAGTVALAALEARAEGRR